MKPIAYIGYFDGSYTINVGMGMGAVVYYEEQHKDNIEIWNKREQRPHNEHNSNNVAEYLALNLLLDYFIENKITDADILIRGDSELVIKQMTGEYRIKKGRYVRHALIAKDKVKLFKNLRLYWCPREDNVRADELSKMIL